MRIRVLLIFFPVSLFNFTCLLRRYSSSDVSLVNTTMKRSWKRLSYLLALHEEREMRKQCETMLKIAKNLFIRLGELSPIYFKPSCFCLALGSYLIRVLIRSNIASYLLLYSLLNWPVRLLCVVWSAVTNQNKTAWPHFLNIVKE